MTHRGSSLYYWYVKYCIKHRCNRIGTVFIARLLDMSHVLLPLMARPPMAPGRSMLQMAGDAGTVCAFSLVISTNESCNAAGPHAIAASGGAAQQGRSK
jgi:hypothetical protein